MDGLPAPGNGREWSVRFCPISGDVPVHRTLRESQRLRRRRGHHHLLLLRAPLASAVPRRPCGSLPDEVDGPGVATRVAAFGCAFPNGKYGVFGFDLRDPRVRKLKRRGNLSVAFPEAFGGPFTPTLGRVGERPPRVATATRGRLRGWCRNVFAPRVGLARFCFMSSYRSL